MRWTPLALTVLLLATPATLVAAGSGSIAGFGVRVGLGEQTTHIQVVDSQSLGVMAGLVTVERTALGVSLDSQAAPATGWVLVAPEGQALPAANEALEVTDPLAFEDPNGAVWEAREVTYDAGTAWVVPVGEVHHDDALEADYNWALVVDWNQVPQDVDLEVHHLESLTLG